MDTTPLEYGVVTWQRYDEDEKSCYGYIQVGSVSAASAEAGAAFAFPEAAFRSQSEYTSLELASTKNAVVSEP
jgi:hypothetical protein